MNIQFAFLLTFIAGGIAVWLLLSMSGRVARNRINTISQHIRSIGGSPVSIDLTERQACPFSQEYHDPDLAYKFYRARYAVGQEEKELWAVLEMKQNRYGPSSAIKEHWIWR